MIVAVCECKDTVPFDKIDVTDRLDKTTKKCKVCGKEWKLGVKHG